MTPEDLLRNHANYSERKRAGPFDHWEISVWWCEDDVCDCTQPRITAWFKHRDGSHWYVPVIVWEGEFRSDGAWSEANAELAQALAYLIVVQA